MGKGAHRYKDRCDEKKVRKNWPFPPRKLNKAIEKANQKDRS